MGIIQGVSEFIPISSSGHLILTEKLLNLDVGSLLFDVTLHLGTLLALVFYFRRDLLDIARSLLKTHKDRLGFYLALGTLPAVVAGYWLQALAENNLRNAWLVAFNLFWVALLMLRVDRLEGQKALTQMKPQNALVVGAAQALALLPGISRSGITIVAGISQGFKRAEAARFSFLLAIPVTLGAILKLLVDSGASEISAQLGVFSAGVISAAVSGYLAIDFLLKYLKKHGLRAFAYYRIVLALAVLIILGI